MALVQLARDLVQRVVVPTFVNEARRPRPPVEVATRLLGMPFEVLAYLRSNQLRGDDQARAARNGAAHAESGFVFAARADEVPPGGTKVVTVAGHAVVLYQLDGRFYATSNLCPHAAGPLGDGEINGTEVTCPYHGWRFDVPTGRCLTMEGETLPTYAVQNVDGRILIRIT